MGLNGLTLRPACEADKEQATKQIGDGDVVRTIQVAAGNGIDKAEEVVEGHPVVDLISMHGSQECEQGCDEKPNAGCQELTIDQRSRGGCEDHTSENISTFHEEQSVDEKSVGFRSGVRYFDRRECGFLGSRSVILGLCFNR